MPAGIKAHGLALCKGMHLLPKEEHPAAQPEPQPIQPDQKIEDEWQAAYRRWAEQDRLESLASEAGQECCEKSGPEEVLTDARKIAPSDCQVSGSDSHAVAEGSDGRVQNTSTDGWSATVRLVADIAPVRGVLVDLGLGSCVFRTSGAYPGVLACAVEVEFRMRGLHFRMAGITKSLVDKHCAEIAFSQMSMPRREELAQLLDELHEQNRQP